MWIIPSRDPCTPVAVHPSRIWPSVSCCSWLGHGLPGSCGNCMKSFRHICAMCAEPLRQAQHCKLTLHKHSAMMLHCLQKLCNKYPCIPETTLSTHTFFSLSHSNPCGFFKTIFFLKNSLPFIFCRQILVCDLLMSSAAP